MKECVGGRKGESLISLVLSCDKFELKGVCGILIKDVCVFLFSIPSIQI